MLTLQCGKYSSDTVAGWCRLVSLGVASNYGGRFCALQSWTSRSDFFSPAKRAYRSCLAELAIISVITANSILVEKLDALFMHHRDNGTPTPHVIGCDGNVGVGSRIITRMVSTPRIITWSNHVSKSWRAGLGDCNRPSFETAI